MEDFLGLERGIAERIADTVFPLMLFTPIYAILLLLKCHALVSLLGAFLGSVCLMFLSSAIDGVLHKRKIRRKMEENYDRLNRPKQNHG